jgi:argininosuccinate synthase
MGAKYEEKYILSTALARPLITKKLIDIANKEDADAIAHGSTGKGNDQVRFEVSAAYLAPELKVIAPVRIWELKSREEEIDYAKKYNIPISITKKNPYSIDRNIWGISIECGILENPENEPPEDAYLLTKSPEDSPNKPAYVSIEFDRSRPAAIDGKEMDIVDIVQHLNDLASSYGIGRTDIVENRLVGIKSREIYEAPAAAVLYEAKRSLEELVLDREAMHLKDMLSVKYAELVYYGLWFTPLRKALDEFSNSLLKNLTGEVKLKLYKGNCTATSRKSPYSLYDIKLATYEKEDIFDQKQGEAFCNIWGLPLRVQGKLKKSK